MGVENVLLEHLKCRKLSEKVIKNKNNVYVWKSHLGWTAIK